MHFLGLQEQRLTNCKSVTVSFEGCPYFSRSISHSFLRASLLMPSKSQQFLFPYVTLGTIQYSESSRVEQKMSSSIQQSLLFLLSLSSTIQDISKERCKRICMACLLAVTRQLRQSKIHLMVLSMLSLMVPLIHYVRIALHCLFKISHHCRILNRHNYTGSDEGKLSLSVPTNR